MKGTRLIRFLIILPTLIFASAISAFSTNVQSDSITVSLITCWPGDDVYELCGHEAIRVRGEGIDSVWNYGTFDFAAPNFLYRFVKGQTDYMLSSYPFVWFMPEYRQTGRRVVEQDLNLTQAEASRLLSMLREEALPQNRTYRYNYVKDNCATRIVDRIDEALGSKVIYPDSVHYGTFRHEMRAFHANYPWYQFGIDLALGSGLDYKLRGTEEMFVPLDMMHRAASAHFADGRPMVKATRVLYEGTQTATLPPTPWWLTPMAFAILVFLISGIVALVDLRKKIITKSWWSVYFGLCGLTGCLIAFLVFASEHEATSPNILILWLNPLQFLTAISVWSAKMRWLAKFMNWYNVIIVGLLLLLWPFQPQSANPAFFPLMASAVLLGAVYAIIGGKSVFNKGRRRSVAREVSNRKPVISNRNSARGNRPTSKK